MFQMFAMFGLVFGPLAGIMAFLITYEEYSHHHFPGKKAMMLSAQAGVVAFLAIFCLLLLAGFFMDTFVS
jgi:hypothetical protein